MAKYIDSEILLKKLFPYEVLNDGNYGINAKAVKTAVENTPTADVVEVVRCKDCKHYKEQKRRNGVTIYDCDIISGLFFDDDFCSRGERRRKNDRK